MVDQSGLVKTNPELGYAPLIKAQTILKSENYFNYPGKPIQFVAYSDSQGVTKFDNLPLGRYTISVEKSVPVQLDNLQMIDTVTIRASKLINLTANMVDTLQANVGVSSGLVINEIYYCGPVNKAKYVYDQFIELYNNSDTTVYLDGLILCRSRQTFNPGKDTLDYVQVIYIFQFPGTPKVGRQYPVGPHEYVVIAQDAIDHSQYIETALNLSHADWEFYNPYGAEIDNPAPNVTNVIPENSQDFIINLWHDSIILADGSSFYPGEISDNGYQYYHVPVNTVIDGVEYSIKVNSLKLLNRNVDAGFAGVGLSRYSGKSIQRRQPGFDTDNSSLDFIILDHPTPGY